MMDISQTVQPDLTGINSLFAAYEASVADHACGAEADTLAAGVFRFMMLDQDLLAYSLRKACASQSWR